MALSQNGRFFARVIKTNVCAPTNFIISGKIDGGGLTTAPVGFILRSSSKQKTDEAEK